MMRCFPSCFCCVFLLVAVVVIIVVVVCCCRRCCCRCCFCCRHRCCRCCSCFCFCFCCGRCGRGGESGWRWQRQLWFLRTCYLAEEGGKKAGNDNLFSSHRFSTCCCATPEEEEKQAGTTGSNDDDNDVFSRIVFVAFSLSSSSSSAGNSDDDDVFFFIFLFVVIVVVIVVAIVAGVVAVVLVVTSLPLLLLLLLWEMRTRWWLEMTTAALTWLSCGRGREKGGQLRPFFNRCFPYLLLWDTGGRGEKGGVIATMMTTFFPSCFCCVSKSGCCLLDIVVTLQVEKEAGDNGDFLPNIGCCFASRRLEWMHLAIPWPNHWIGRTRVGVTGRCNHINQCASCGNTMINNKMDKFPPNSIKRHHMDNPPFPLAIAVNFPIVLPE